MLSREAVSSHLVVDNHAHIFLLPVVETHSLAPGRALTVGVAFHLLRQGLLNSVTFRV